MRTEIYEFEDEKGKAISFKNEDLKYFYCYVDGKGILQHKYDTTKIADERIKQIFKNISKGLREIHKIVDDKKTNGNINIIR